MDVMTSAERSAHMARIRAKDTRPEVVVRRAAHALGLRFRLHRSDLPGSPDLVFPRYRRALFVHGCFWHRHQNCRLAYSPRTNAEFWKAKFERNVERDARAIEALRQAGWKTSIIWECETRQAGTVPEKLSGLFKDGTK